MFTAKQIVLTVLVFLAVSSRLIKMLLLPMVLITLVTTTLLFWIMVDTRRSH